MKHYYINLNPQPTGEYEIHTDECIYFKLINRKEYLGYFKNARCAKLAARIKGFTNADGCHYCCNEADSM